MALALRQSVTGFATGSTQATATLGSTPIEGNLLVATLHLADAITVTPPTGWVEDASQAAAGSVCVSKLFAKVAGASEPTNPSWTLNPNTDWGLVIYEFDGAQTSNASYYKNTLDTAFGESDAPATATMDLLVAGSLCVMSGSVRAEDETDWQHDGTFTDVVTRGVSSVLTLFSAFRFGDAAGETFAFSGTFSGVFKWSIVVTEYERQNGMVC
jgi:hypothetical protein